MKKKLLSAVLSAAMLVSVFTNFVFAAAESTDIEIRTAAELAALADRDITGAIELLCDIDMADTEMSPIASLNGDFDGNGYKISNLSISENTTDDTTHTALISKLNGTVRDTVFENPNVSLNYNKSYGGSYVSAAIVAGYANEGEANFINCAIIGDNANVTLTTKKDSHSCGAFLGYANESAVTIENCYSTADVSCYGYRGGLIGTVGYSSADIKNSAVVGDVSETSSYYGAGGGMIGNILGFSSTVNFTNCFYGGTLTGSKKYGFAYITGRYSYPTVTAQNCYYDSTKNKSLSIYSPFEVFPSAAHPAGTAEGKETGEITAALLGSAFTDNGDYPVTAWYPALDESAEHNLTVTVYPENAEVTLLDETGTAVSGEKSENVYTYNALNGKYTCTVGGVQGYEEKTFAVNTGRVSDMSRKVTLAEKTYEVTFNVTPENASFTLSKDGRTVSPVSERTYSLKSGEYSYLAEADGYTSKSGTINITRDRTYTIELTASGSAEEPLPDFLNGGGTEENPYLIQNKNDLIFLANSFNTSSGEYSKAHFLMTADIDLGFEPWTPLGKNYVYGFDGVFDGGNHKITGLNVDNTDMYCGLFGCLKDAEVKNLTVSGSVYSNELRSYVGGIAARACGNTTISNCANTAVISAAATDSVGGFVGYCNKSDDIGYQWIDNNVKFVNCYNSGDIIINGTDNDQFSEGLAGGIAGYSKNCVQFENCLNTGNIKSANTAAGICGNTGSAQGDNCNPYFKNCLNTGKIESGVSARPIYGKGTIAESRVTNCYALDSSENAYVTSKTADELKTLAEDLGGGWEQKESFPVPTGVEYTEQSNLLISESAKYNDLVSLSETDKVYSFLKDGETAGENIGVSSAVDANEYVLAGESGGVKLVKANDTNAAITVNAVLTFTADGLMYKKSVKAIAVPDTGAKDRFLDKLAVFYASKNIVSDWAVLGMNAYSDLKGDTEHAKISDSAKQNYINLAIDKLSQSTALITDRAKGEIILSALGMDTTKLFPVNSAKSFDNAALLKAENAGSAYSNAIWMLLADMQGNTKLDSAKIQSLVDILEKEQGSNGLYHYTYGEYDYTDPDSTGWALAAIARFVQEDGDTYNVKAKAASIAEKAIAGLSAAQGSNGSFGNIYTDSMVITGLVAYGIDPESDPRFVKNGFSLADAPMYYVNSQGTGFVSAYSDGEADNSATEQGFMGLVSLAAFNANGKQPYNLYSFTKKNEISVITTPARQPAKATGKGNVTVPSEPETDVTFDVTVSISALDSTWLAAKSVTVKNGSKVYHALKKAFEENNITADGLDEGYIKSVTANGKTLAQFDKGVNSGWLYYVNGDIPQVGITDYTLNSGDKIELKYTSDYKQDTPSISGGGSSKKDDTKKDEEKADENPSWENPFADVNDKDWFFDAVKFSSEKGLFNGVSDSEFAPYDNVTRGMFVTIMHRTANSPESNGNKFADVKAGSYYEKATAWAAENGIVNGVSETEFAPDDNITREQIAVILYNYAKGEAPEKLSADAFADTQSISDWAADAISWAVSKGIINGKENNMLDPKGTATRAEAAAMMMRFINLG